MFVRSAAAASAEPPTPTPPAPPNCSPAVGRALARPRRPICSPIPVNDFFATLAGQSRDEMRPQVQAYLDANPQVRADLEGIKQPAVAFLDRCGYANPLDNP
jgi:heme-binding protein